MNDDRIAAIEQAIADHESQGRHWTNQAIYDVVGGNYASLSQHLKARRAGILAAGAVAVLESEARVPSPPAPESPALAAPMFPLAQARTARAQAVAQEQALAAQHTRLKQQRQGLEQQLLTLDASRMGRSPAGDLARRREVAQLTEARALVEAQRQQVCAQAMQSGARRLEAEDAWRTMQEQAGRWLRRLRQRQREARTLPQAWARGDAAEEAQQSADQLAALIGDEAVAALAADPALQPDWLRD